ncbi:MAG: multiple sugar transport system permease protein [Streptomyces sp.]|jgi:multiple sugar transport system permease protein|nr:multiple sugar transport system permease protein [Streptomyces sp.]
MTTAAAQLPSSATTDASRPAVTVRRRWTEHGLLFIAPFALIYVLFLVWPIVLGFKMSFGDDNIAGSNTRFVGFDNYVEAFRDSAMWDSLWHTVFFTVITTIPLVALGLGLALLVHNLRVVQWLWRLSFFAPFLLPSAVVALVWQWIYQPSFGLADWFLKNLGYDGQFLWLGDKNHAMGAIALTTIWWTVGFNFLLYLAALQAIPEQLYEAASLDGANAWQKLTGITLPMLRRTTGLVVVLQLLASLKVFDQIYIMTGGGPEDSTRSVVQYIYYQGFTGYRIGYASAISYILFVIIVVVSLVQLRLTRASGKEAV